MLIQSIVFVLIGGIQVLLDWLIFSGLFWLFGTTAWRNVVSRGAAALIGTVESPLPPAATAGSGRDGCFDLRQ